MKKTFLFLFLLISSLFAREAKEIINSSCHACHGSKMEKAGFGVSKIPNILSSNYILEALRDYKLGKKNDYKMGIVMTNQLKSLSDEELKALAKYIPTLK